MKSKQDIVPRAVKDVLDAVQTLHNLDPLQKTIRVPVKGSSGEHLKTIFDHLLKKSDLRTGMVTFSFDEHVRPSSPCDIGPQLVFKFSGEVAPKIEALDNAADNYRNFDDLKMTAAAKTLLAGVVQAHKMPKPNIHSVMKDIALAIDFELKKKGEGKNITVPFPSHRAADAAAGAIKTLLSTLQYEFSPKQIVVAGHDLMLSGENVAEIVTKVRESSESSQLMATVSKKMRPDIATHLVGATVDPTRPVFQFI